MTADQLSSEETAHRWKFILAISNLKQPTTTTTSTRKRKRSRFSSLSSASLVVANNDDDHDPFDCRSIAVLSTHDIVENTLKKYVNEWKQLDDRKVVKNTEAAGSRLYKNSDGDILVNAATSADATNKIPTTRHHSGGWRSMKDRLSLPERFNYTEKPPEDDECSGDRVISSDNPTQTLSYHQELWKLFDSIPTYQQLEDKARDGNQVDNTLRVYQETHVLKSGTADCHALSRLRMPDRHGLPTRLTPFCYTSSNKQRLNNYSSQSDTITFEIWRRQPKRGVSSDCQRMVLEFLGSQTLWDFHMILSQMAEDDLWKAAVAIGDGKTCTSTEHDTNFAITHTAVIGGSNRKEDMDSNQRNDKVKNDEDYDQHKPSGCFFIENTFYKTGSVDYTKHIMDWIDGNNPSKANFIRRSYLGISSSIAVTNDKTMKETRLGQVPFRLNIRNYHACHGDVETAVMLVDRKLVHFNGSEDSTDKVLYPLIHDIWTAPHTPAVPLCDACRIYQAAFVTSTNCNTTDGGPRSICHECCTDLKLLDKEKHSVKLIIPWRNQADLSNTIAREQGTNF